MVYSTMPLAGICAGLFFSLCIQVSIANEIQIINATTQEFLDGLGDKMITWEMNNVGFDYETVAIIGSQSSGKSTLLNNMFGTNFDVMNPMVRRLASCFSWDGCITLNKILNDPGIWLSRDQTHHVIVMDVEGSDGGNRGDDQKFERKSALFALACSRVVIINMWENQVGLYNGANMGLLKIIFEEHLSLYGNLDKHLYQFPKIIFLIQTHSSGIPLESLARTITLNLDRIWDSIEKPEDLRNKSLEDYFDFGFESLPHLRLAPEQYQSQVCSLRRRFVERESTEYIFKGAHPNPVPADGLEQYMRTIWKTIRLNENLDLPGQHELLARAMCNRISTSILEKYRNQIASQLAILSEGQLINELGLLLRHWKHELLAHFDKDARRYLQHVYTETRRTLIDSYHNEVMKLFTGQLRNLCLSLLAAFDEVLKDAIAKGDSDFYTITSSKMHGYKEHFTAAARNTAIDDANWDWAYEFQDLQSSMAERINACEKERKAALPLKATTSEWVTSTKWMSTEATIYRDGQLIVLVDTDNDTFNHALRVRVIIVVVDGKGSTIGMTNTMSCTLRGGFNPFGAERYGRDIFSLQFPREVGRRAVRLDIYQWDGGSPGHHLTKILEAAKAAGAAIAVLV